MENLKYDEIEISENKLVGYILNSSHIDGVHKAKFFEKFGFTPTNWIELQKALKTHVEKRENLEVDTNAYGKKYIIFGTIDALDGRRPKIRSVWFIENKEKILKFVTAYPIKDDKRDR
ncbi:MAG: DUF6883 domain-containing protein [Ignavibacteria bacterium]